MNLWQETAALPHWRGRNSLSLSRRQRLSSLRKDRRNICGAELPVLTGTKFRRKCERSNAITVQGFNMIANSENPTESGQKQSGEARAKDGLEAEDVVTRDRSCQIATNEKCQTGQQGGEHKSPYWTEPTFIVRKHVHKPRS